MVREYGLQLGYNSRMAFPCGSPDLPNLNLRLNNCFSKPLGFPLL